MHPMKFQTACSYLSCLRWSIGPSFLVPADAATDRQVIQEIATKVDPADQAMVSLLARSQRAEKTLQDLEAKNALASAVTRIAA